MQLIGRQLLIVMVALSLHTGAAFPPESGRYHLYISYACPWACRCYMFLKSKGLEDAIGMTVCPSSFPAACAQPPFLLDKKWVWMSRRSHKCASRAHSDWKSYLSVFYASIDNPISLLWVCFTLQSFVLLFCSSLLGWTQKLNVHWTCAYILEYLTHLLQQSCLPVWLSELHARGNSQLHLALVLFYIRGTSQPCAHRKVTSNLKLGFYRELSPCVYSDPLAKS
jgi:hypothetical protein